MDCDIFQDKQVKNELEAYLLGFFYADGCVCGFRNGCYRVFSIALAEKDKDFLQWIADVINKNLNSNYSLKYNENTRSYKLSICKTEFIEKLIGYGIVPNKTYENNDDIFTHIPDDLKWHFIRGYFDGDGSISFASGDNKWVSNIVSLNSVLINTMQTYCKASIGHGTVRHDKKYFRFCLSGNKCVAKFGEMLYKDAHYFMARKKEKFDCIPIYKKRNVYNGITNYHNKYRVNIYSKPRKKQIYLGLCGTVVDAINLYNSYCDECGQQKQTYKGEDLYYE